MMNDFFKVILPFLMCMARHAQITQNNKFAISLLYLKKEVNNEVHSLNTDKQKSLLQNDAMILMGMVKHSQSSQNSKFAMSLGVILETKRSMRKIHSRALFHNKIV